MKDKKFLLYPVYFLLVLFIIDKIFLIDFFRKDFIQPGNAMFYFQRNQLQERIKNDPSLEKGNKKLAVALGDSRAYPFSEPGLSEKEKDNWIIYNFSSPQAVPMYSLMRYERLIEDGIVPDLLYVAISPESFDDSKGAIYDPFMRLGMDEKFKKDYWDLIPWSARYDYILGKVFAFYGLKLDFKMLLDRYKYNRMSDYNPEFNEEVMILNLGKGEYLGYATFANNESKLKKDAIRIKNIYLNRFVVDDTQFLFIEKLLALAEKKGTKVFLVWPRVYIDYRESYRELGLDKHWWGKIKSLANEYKAQAIDFNVESSCDIFNDASHQSIQCFTEQMNYIFDRYSELK
ncbi:DUF1574 domain-containing protein [Leptospira sp. GIMC2001]|uniref:DUF1574 domain-containing protein n=1 Tax=Leptospira sp. GIMC2001 TaxID=1513297 RepID=UPI00234A645E|nr:DUF1574 domain-containing protein [Leptospira sp. GIMC2001]WCL50922.1 DUF1574 domain-containing protein [Leptospira sp. GIMC2001]